jgi:hypothetical protein
MNLSPPPISSGWANDAKSGPVSIWALWFQNIWNVIQGAFLGNDTYVTTTNITSGGVLTKAMKVTKVGRVITVILAYSDTVSTSSTIGATTFSLPYTPISNSVGNAVNITTGASLGSGYVSTNGSLYTPTSTTTAGQVVVMTVTYFTTS